MGAEYTVIRRVARVGAHFTLKPLRILLCGSPGDGKRTLAAELSRRGLIAATVSGCEGDTRRVVDAVSAAELAVIVIDARTGVSADARRHSAIARLLEIRRALLVVNKMDLVDWAQERFDEARAAYEDFARAAGIEVVACVPVSATTGKNAAALVEQLQLVEMPKPRGPASESPARADQFEATIAWFGTAPLLPGRDYLLALGATTATATITPLKHKVNLDNFEHVAAATLEANEIGVAQLELAEPIDFEPYERSHERGGFTLLDRFTRETVGAGMIRFALRRSQNVHWQAVDIDRAARAAMKGQRPCTLWFTGLSGAGKSTIANLVEKKLHAMGRHTYLLDGDNVRHGLNKDLGFTEAARVENIRRVSEVARLMTDAGLIVITAFISPFRSERASARALFPPGEFLEIFIDTPIAEAERRDPKGLYAKARRGELKNFTGIDSPYERPESAEVTIDTTRLTAEGAAAKIVEEMRLRGL